MNFDIDLTLTQMLDAMKEVFKDEWDSIKDLCEDVFHENKEDILELGKLRLSGELSQEKFESKMEDQVDALKTELLARSVKIKALAQQAVNSALKALYEAIEAAI